MILDIIKYDNRKYYVRSTKHRIGGGYINLPELAYILRMDTDLTIKVVKKATGEDITKDVLVSLIDSSDFTERDLYSLVRKELRLQLGSNRNLSPVREFYTTGIEL